jgi:hypothetical protein
MKIKFLTAHKVAEPWDFFSLDISFNGILVNEA